MSGSRTSAGSAMFELIDETRLLFHRLRRTAEIIHRQGEFSAGRRGVLRSLYSTGPQTVPQLARARPVSRQHIQMLVNPLVDEGYLELVDNPEHKRSRLVRLTAKGKEMAEAIHLREIDFLEGLSEGPPAGEIRAAAETLRELRRALSGRKAMELAERTGR